MKPSRCHLRPANIADLPVINAIYNHYVLNSCCTYQETPETDEGRAKWFAGHDRDHPVVVAELDGETVGWGSLSPFHPRSAYRFTVEDSVYVSHDCLRRGIGTALLEDLLARAAGAGHHSVLALIDSEQAGSIALHAKHGFQPSPVLKQVGYKFGRWLDVLYMQRLF